MISYRIEQLYKLGPQIGFEGFCLIQLEIKVQSNQDVAIKIEKVKSMHLSIMITARSYQIQKEKYLFPQTMEFYRFLIFSQVRLEFTGKDVLQKSVIELVQGFRQDCIAFKQISKYTERIMLINTSTKSIIIKEKLILEKFIMIALIFKGIQYSSRDDIAPFYIKGQFHSGVRKIIEKQRKRIYQLKY